MQIVKANKTESRIRLGLQGPAGAGKTYSALQIAFGLCNSWEKIVVIDTESNSAHLYSDLGNYSIVSLSKPYSPEKYIQAIELCEAEGFAVILVDSLSHSWDGIGGVLDIHANMLGNSFQNWSKVKPRFHALVQTMLSSKAHVIATMRVKSDYVLSEKNGKHIPEKVGLKAVAQDGVDYEFTLVFDIDIKHMVTSSKDRTGIFMDQPPFIPTEKTGARIRKWCENSLTEAEVLRKIQQAHTEEEIRRIYNQSGAFKETLKDVFKTKWNEIILERQSNNGTATDSK